MTQQEYWKLVDSFVNRALEAGACDRDRILAEIENPQVRDEVSSLLNAEASGQEHGVSALIGAAPCELLEDKENLWQARPAGRFKITGFLGRGGMGEVCRARDPLLDRDVALKFLNAELTSNPEYRRRFEREAKAASALNHPAIITVHEVGESEGSLFIATEYVDGVSLRERLKDGALPAPEAYRIAAQITSAIEAAHREGIIHRDLKPENVMLRRDGLVKVLDFGLARVLSAPELAEVSALTSPGWLIGTPAYMAPEQIRALPAQGASDCWSVGIILYEMISGRHPFQGATPSDTMAAILERQPAPLSDPAWPLLSALLTKDPSQRLSDTRAILEWLEKLQRPRASSRRYVAIGAAAIIPLLAWGWFHSTPNAADTSLTYSLLVQRTRNGQPDGAPFQSTGTGVFESGWKFRIEARNSSPGYLYLISDSRLIFPLTREDRKQEWQSGWLVFDEKPGREVLWVVFATERVSIIENAIGSREIISGIHDFLNASRASRAVIEPDRNRWSVTGTGNVFAQPIPLEHR